MKHFVYLFLIVPLLGEYATLPQLYDPEAGRESLEKPPGLWNLRVPLKNRWPAPKVANAGVHSVHNGKGGIEVFRPNQAAWDEANRAVQIAMAKLMEDFAFGLRVMDGNQKLEGALEQLKTMTNLISDLYAEVRGNTITRSTPEGELTSNNSILSVASPITSLEGLHFVMPPDYTKTTTEVPEIYYEIFKAYKDKRLQHGGG